MSEGRTTRRIANARSVGFPVRPFLFTLDQVAGMLMLEQGELENKYIYFRGRSQGRLLANDDRIKAVNIAPSGDAPEWRVSEEDLIRWCKKKDIVAYH